MVHEQIVQRILDQKIETESFKPLGWNDAVVEAIIEYARTKVTQSGKSFSLRNTIPLLSGLRDDPELQNIVKQLCARYDVPYEASVITNNIDHAAYKLVDQGSQFAICFIRDLGGDKVRQLLNDLLTEADDKGIGRQFIETGYPEQIDPPLLGRLMGAPPLYINPEEKKLENDVYQICDLLQKDVLRELGLPE